MGPGAGGPAPGPTPGAVAPIGAPGPTAAPPGGGPAPAGPTGSPQEILQGIINTGKQIEQTLTLFAQAMPNGARFFQQANEFIQQGIAAEIAAASQMEGAGGGEPPTTSPTEAGPSFPGGGFGSAARP